MPVQDSIKREGEKFFFYYPGYNETRQFRRRVIAGYFDGSRISIAEAMVFPGRKEQFIKGKHGGFTYIPGIKPDNFSTKYGRNVASDRARGGHWEHDVITNTDVFVKNEAPEAKRTLFSIDVPADTEVVGRLFVEAVELYLKTQGFPEKIRKAPKQKPIDLPNTN